MVAGVISRKHEARLTAEEMMDMRRRALVSARRGFTDERHRQV